MINKKNKFQRSIAPSITSILSTLSPSLIASSYRRPPSLKQQRHHLLGSIRVEASFPSVDWQSILKCIFKSLKPIAS